MNTVSQPVSPTPRVKQFVKIRPDSPPEVGKGMTGIVRQHPFHPPGTEVTTTPVLSIEGNKVETNGSIYEICN